MHKLLKIGASAFSVAVVALSVPLQLVSAADNNVDTTPKSIWDNTRYYPDWVSKTVDKTFDLIKGVADELLDVSPETIDDTYIFPFDKVVKNFENRFNSGGNQSYTIQDCYTFIAKRRIEYPVKNWAETDYMFCYVDKNEDTYTTQTFGDYTISPNTMLIIRDTNFNGVHAFSVPLGINNITDYTARNSAFSFEFRQPPNSSFLITTESGDLTYQFYGLGYNERLKIINNDYNTITDTFLNYWYNTYPQDYLNTFGNGTLSGVRPLNDFEVLFGNAYKVGYSQPLMDNYVGSWYLTSGFVNLHYPDDFKTYVNYDPNNINPKKPPVFVYPNDNPLSSGNTIDNSTINNYNDYGMTIVNGELHIDPDILAGALGALIDPTLQGLLDATFGAQPDIGVSFDSPDLELNNNYINMVTNWLDSLVNYPVWTAPEYPAVNTSAFIPATYPTYSTVTIPDDMAQNMGDILTTGWGIFDTLGILGFICPIIIMLLLWRFTGQ